jgi:hypothetical protein
MLIKDLASVAGPENLIPIARTLSESLNENYKDFIEYWGGLSNDTTASPRILRVLSEYAFNNSDYPRAEHYGSLLLNTFKDYPFEEIVIENLNKISWIEKNETKITSGFIYAEL